MKYDVVVIGAGPGGIFSAYELIHQNKNLKIAVFEEGQKNVIARLTAKKFHPVSNVRLVRS